LIFYNEEMRKAFFKCSLGKYTLSDIINPVFEAVFTLKKFDDHPAWANHDLPDKIIILAKK